MKKEIVICVEGMDFKSNFEHLHIRVILHYNLTS